MRRRPERREAAHAARPTRPRYGNSLRKTLSERERPKPSHGAVRAVWRRLSPSQLRRIRDRSCRLPQLPAFIPWRAERSMVTGRLALGNPTISGVYVKTLKSARPNQIRACPCWLLGAFPLAKRQGLRLC
jgi:hypothetical protein